MLPPVKKFLQYFILLLAVPMLLFALYTWVALTWVYSSGERAGYVQKLSQKGWVCKTYEGELILVSMPGTQAEKFFFTVRDQNVAKKINETVGERVRLAGRVRVRAAGGVARRQRRLGGLHTRQDIIRRRPACTVSAAGGTAQEGQA